MLSDTTPSPMRNNSNAPKPASDRRDAAILAAIFSVTALAFLPTLRTFLDVWRAQPYTHGYLLALATVWLVWRERDVFREPTRTWAASFLAAAGLSLVWLVAAVADARVISEAAVLGLFFLWPATVYGPRAAQKLGPIAAIFLLAIPVWGALTRVLQSMTVAMSGVFVTLARVPAVIDGDMIHIQYGSFLVAGGCAGLNYLMSGLTIGALYAHLFTAGWRGRLGVMGLATLLPMVGNWIRVAGLVVLGHTSQMESIFITNSPAHLAFGWGIFLGSMLIFFPLAQRVTDWAARRKPQNDRTAPDTVGFAERPALAAGALASTVMLLGPVLYVAIGALPVRDVAPLALAPYSAEWRAEQGGRPYPWHPAFVGASQEESALWTNGADRVLLDRLTYREQAQGAELIGYQSRIAPDSLVAAERLFGAVGPERRLVNEAIVRDGDSHLLVWYWYRVGGLETESATRAKLLEVLAFFRRATVSELVALSTACEPESCAAASQVLGRFLGTG